LETLIAIQSFSDKNNNVILNSEINTQHDLANYFFNIEEMKRNKIYLFIGNNLRYENPLLNIKFKKLIKTKTLLIGYIGVKHDTNFNILHLGTSLKTLKHIFEGKHFFIRLVNMFFKNNFNIKNIFKDKF
jgi:NADH dehydrogenase/NADH:ubiquinone oxidoreductase subunit G